MFAYFLVDRTGRRPLFITSSILVTFFLVFLGAVLGRGTSRPTSTALFVVIVGACLEKLSPAGVIFFACFREAVKASLARRFPFFLFSVSTSPSYVRFSACRGGLDLPPELHYTCILRALRSDVCISLALAI